MTDDDLDRNLWDILARYRLRLAIDAAVLAERDGAMNTAGVATRRAVELLDENAAAARARQMLVDDLIALGEGKSGKLKLSRGVEQRIADLKDEKAKLREALAGLIGDGHFLQSAWKHAAEVLAATAPKEPAK